MLMTSGVGFGGVVALRDIQQVLALLARGDDGAVVPVPDVEGDGLDHGQRHGQAEEDATTRGPTACPSGSSSTPGPRDRRSPMPVPREGQRRGGEPRQGNGQDRDERRKVARDERRVERATRARRRARARRPARRRRRSRASRSLEQPAAMEAGGDPGRGGHLEADQNGEDPGHRRSTAPPAPSRSPTTQSPMGPMRTSNDRRRSTLDLDEPFAAGQADAQALHELLPRRGQQSRESQQRDHDRARRSRRRR